MLTKGIIYPRELGGFLSPSDILVSRVPQCLLAPLLGPRIPFAPALGREMNLVHPSTQEAARRQPCTPRLQPGLSIPGALPSLPSGPGPTHWARRGAPLPAAP